jgi:hypothetical protein
MMRIMQLMLGPNSNEKKKMAQASNRAAKKKSNAPSDAVAKKASSIYVLCTHLLISSTTHVSSRHYLSAQEPT